MRSISPHYQMHESLNRVHTPYNKFQNTHHLKVFLLAICTRRASVGTLIMEGSSLVIEGEGASLDIVGNLDCKDGECPDIGQYYETGKQRRICPARDSNYQYICNAAVSLSYYHASYLRLPNAALATQVWKPDLPDGSYAVGANWVSGSVPKPTDIVYLGGNNVRQLE